MPETILKTSAHMLTQVDAAGLMAAPAVPDPDTTLDADVAAGAAVISVVAEGGAVDGDLIQIGTGDTIEVGRVASTVAGSITLDQALLYPHVSGEAVQEVTKLDLGHVGEGGVDFNVSEDIFEAGAATSAKVLIRKTTRITQGITWPLIEFTAAAFAHVFGIPQAKVVGTGAADTPFRAALVSDDIKTVTKAHVYVECTNENGEVVEFQGFGLTPDLNKSWNVSRNASAEIAAGGDIKTIVMIHYL